jgi:hypothetical protein
MYQAIETRYAGPTNHRGARIIVRAQAGRMTVSWDHALNAEQNHLAAARAFAKKWGWGGRWRGGANATNTGYVFVCTQERAGGVEDVGSSFVVE